MYAPNVVFALVLGTILVGVGESFSEMEMQKWMGLYSLCSANNYFALNLHRKLSETTEGNVFFSPFTVSSVLAMLYRGADGETYEELRKVLGYEEKTFDEMTLDDETVFSSYKYYVNEVIGNKNPVYTIYCVSAMIVDDSFPVLPRYKSEMQDIFQSYVQEASLADEKAVVVDKLNTWVKIKTKGAIESLAEDIHPNTNLFLTSAAYFKAGWKVKFDPKNTKHHVFYNGGQKSNASDVLMMYAHTSVQYYGDDDVDEVDNVTAVELEYEGQNMSMVIVLPREINGLHDVEQNMTAARMMDIRRFMNYKKTRLTVPKFKFETDRSLSRALKDLGLSKIFSPAADLSGMISEGQGASVALDDVKHQAFIEVDERGSTASAKTRTVIYRSLLDPVFTVDHPFLFAIFDTRFDLILFMGRVNRL